MGSGKHVSQKNGGRRRPASHSGKKARSASECRWEAEREKLVSEREALSAKWVQERANRAAELEEISTEREKIAMELAAERGKTLALQAQVDDLKARVRGLSDLAQKQQLDIEWMTGLQREGVPPPSILRRRRQHLEVG